MPMLLTSNIRRSSLTPAAVNECSEQAEGLAAWMPLARGMAGVHRIVDPRRGRFASVNGSPTWEHDVTQGWGLRFSGSSNDLIDMGSDDLGLVHDVTVAAWIRTPPSWSGVAAYPQVIAYAPSTTIHGVNLDIPSPHSRCPRLIFRVAGRGWGDDMVIGAASLPTNTAVYLCGVRRGGMAEIYVNGVLSATVACGTGALDRGPGTIACAIGNLNPGITNGRLAGVVYEARIYRRALPPRLIAAMAAAQARWELYAPRKPRRMALPPPRIAIDWSTNAQADADASAGPMASGDWASDASCTSVAAVELPLWPTGRLELRGPADDAIATDQAPVLITWPPTQATVELPLAARPADGERLALAVRRVCPDGLWAGQAAVIRLDGVGEVAVSSLVGPVWPDESSWPVSQAAGQLRVHALWDRPVLTAGVASAWLQTELEAGDIIDLLQVTPKTFARSLRAEVERPMARTRYRWRWIGAAGQQELSPWSAWVDPVEASDLTLNIQELT